MFASKQSPDVSVANLCESQRVRPVSIFCRLLTICRALASGVSVYLFIKHLDACSKLAGRPSAWTASYPTVDEKLHGLRSRKVRTTYESRYRTIPYSVPRQNPDPVIAVCS
eukprot:scaffold394_cov41-Prasinocladus_malaysianus.AAC.1